MSFRALYFPALLLVVALAPAFPQDITGSIFGSVRDASGSAVVSAQVKLVNVATNAERNVRTNDLGDFVISGVQPAEYRIVVEMPGFKSLERRGVFLTASDRLSVGVLVLELGVVTEKVEVTAQGTAVQTASGERSAVLTSSQVDDLTVVGRQVTSLLSLLPGVVDPAVNQPASPTSSAASSFDVMGNRTYDNNLSLDGVDINQTGGAANTFVAVSMDSVAEVKVLTSNYQAEYGHLVGSNIQIVTKSGTRDFHGGMSYYKRNEEFNANNFFNNLNDVPNPRYRYTGWEYNLGGPVYIPGKLNRHRDKLFAFWNQEYWPLNTPGALNSITVPTALERAGNFSQSVQPNGALIPIKDPLTGAPFPANSIPASRLDPNGQALLNVFPLPNFTNTAISKGNYNYVSQSNTASSTNMMDLKLDYILRPAKDTLTYTVAGETDSTVAPNSGQLTVSFPLLPTSSSHQLHWLMALHETHIFSPTLINELTVAFLQAFTKTSIPSDVLSSVQRSTYGFKAGQLNPANNSLDLIPSMSFGGVTGAASVTFDGRFPINNARDNVDLSDSVSKTLGEHSFKAGIFFDHYRITDGFWANGFNGTLDFGVNANNPLNSGDPYSNADLGNFNSYSEATARPHVTMWAANVEWFLQDNWKVTRKLTLDYGVRLTWFQPWYMAGNQMAGFVPSMYNPAQQVSLIAPATVGGQRVGEYAGVVYPAALIGAIAPGSGNPTNGTVVAANDPSYPRGLVASPGMIPAPRFGFAYDPFGDGKTAIRGGFGMFYDRQLDNFEPSGYSFPIVRTPTMYYGTLSTFLSQQGFSTPQAVTGYDRNIKTPTIMSMSFSIQRNIGLGTVVDLGYAGSLGRHLSWSTDPNTIPLGTRFLPQNADPTVKNSPLPDAFLYPLKGYTGITYDSDNANSSYHSLQVSANRRFAKPLQLGASWTWSKTMDYTDTAFGAVATIVPARIWNYGMAAFDRTHALKANWLYDLPKLKTGFKPARAVLNDWQVSGIASFQSGAPVAIGYSLATAVDTTGTPSISSRIIILSNPILPASQRTFSQNFRTTVFAAPPVGSLGDAAKTNVRGPGIDDWDVSLFKTIPIRERLRFQFRAEAYNLFNHTQFNTWNTTARFDAKGNQINAQFGQDTAARNPRIMQFALRLRF